MGSDYGGTEIASALMHVFAKKDKTMPTVVFVLTDGDVRAKIIQDNIQGSLKLIGV